MYEIVHTGSIHICLLIALSSSILLTTYSTKIAFHPGNKLPGIPGVVPKIAKIILPRRKSPGFSHGECQPLFQAESNTEAGYAPLA